VNPSSPPLADSDSTRFSRALRSAILWPIGIIFLTALLLLCFIYEAFEEVKLTDHSFRVLTQARASQDLIVSTERDLRGYLLTGDPDFVKTFDATRHSSDEAFARLRTLVKDNPEQVLRAESLRQAENTWFVQAQTLFSHRSQEIPIHSDWVKMSKAITDDIDSKFDEFTKIEDNLRDARLFRVREMKLGLAYAGSGLILLLVVTVAYQVRKQMMMLAASYDAAINLTQQRHNALARSEADLEEQKEWLRVTLTSIGDGVIVTDPVGRVVLMNPEAERLSGWTQVEALHQPLSTVFRIVHDKTRQPEADLVAKVLAEKKVIALANHTLLLSRSGEEWSIEDSAAPISDAKGKILGVVVVFHVPRIAARTPRSDGPDI
jgi:PAS domain S-box-containing protein